jgi:hypothetical protein
MSRDDVIEEMRRARERDPADPRIGCLGDFVLNVSLLDLHAGMVQVASYDDANGRHAGRDAIDRLREQQEEERLRAKQMEEERLDAEYNQMLNSSRRRGYLNLAGLDITTRARILAELQNIAAAKILERYESGDGETPYWVIGSGISSVRPISFKDARRALARHSRAADLAVLGGVWMGDLGLTARAKYMNVNGDQGFDTLYGDGEDLTRYALRRIFHPSSEDWLVHHHESGPLERAPVHSADIFAQGRQTAPIDADDHLDGPWPDDEPDDGTSEVYWPDLSPRSGLFGRMRGRLDQKISELDALLDRWL